MNLQEPEVTVRDRRAVRKELARIQQANADKLLTAEEVVEEAESEDNPLHPYFDWDDSEAAKKWRLCQARALIREIEVVFPEDSQERFVPKYVSLGNDRKRSGGGYRETKQVLNSKALVKELEETCKRDIDGVLRRYEMLKELCTRVRQAAGIKPAKPTKRGAR